MHCKAADQLAWFSVAELDIVTFINIDSVSYGRIDPPSSRPGDDLWQNEQPFGPSSLSTVSLLVEIRGSNQRCDDTQPSVVVLSVLGQEVEGKHTIADLFFSSFPLKSKTNTHNHMACSYYVA